MTLTRFCLIKFFVRYVITTLERGPDMAFVHVMSEKIKLIKIYPHMFICLKQKVHMLLVLDRDFINVISDGN